MPLPGGVTRTPYTLLQARPPQTTLPGSRAQLTGEESIGLDTPDIQNLSK